MSMKTFSWFKCRRTPSRLKTVVKKSVIPLYYLRVVLKKERITELVC